MPTIRIPETLQLLSDIADDNSARAPFSFCKNFMCNLVLLDPKWAETMPSIYMAMDLRGRFSKPEPKEGELVEISAAEAAAIRERLENPSNKQPMPLLLQIRPYLDAALFPEASATKPATKNTPKGPGR